MAGLGGADDGAEGGVGLGAPLATEAVIAKHGRATWQKASGYTTWARAEAAIGRFKQVIGDGLRARTVGRRATEVGVAVHALNRMLKVVHPSSVRIA